MSISCDRVGCLVDLVLLCRKRSLKTECSKEIGRGSFGKVFPKYSKTANNLL